MSKPGQDKAPNKATNMVRQSRLKQALRDNLKRRKQAARQNATLLSGAKSDTKKRS